MKNTYAELKNRHQERVNTLPLMFAFSDKQFEEAMKKAGLSVNDTDKITSIGAGGFIRKADAKLVHDTFEQNDQEMRNAIAADKDGTGFIRDMFYYELANHEYCINYDLEPTLDALGMTEDDVLNNPALLNGLKLAREQYLAEAEANGWY